MERIRRQLASKKHGSRRPTARIYVSHLGHNTNMEEMQAFSTTYMHAWSDEG